MSHSAAVHSQQSRGSPARMCDAQERQAVNLTLYVYHSANNSYATLSGGLHFRAKTLLSNCVSVLFQAYRDRPEEMFVTASNEHIYFLNQGQQERRHSR